MSTIKRKKRPSTSLSDSDKRNFQAIDEKDSESEVIDQDSDHKHWNESRRVIFSLGALLGLLIALYVGTNVDRQTYEGLDKYVNFESLQEYMVDLKDSVPSTLSALIADFQLTNFHKPHEDLTTNFAVGRQLRRELNLTSKHPVIMVPGVTSTGIESWGLHKSSECDSEPHFRKRLWGSFYMLKTMVLEKSCWLKHVMLDPETGLDPSNYTLRAAQGFEAADFFVAGFWIWNKVLQNLGAIGYEPNKMITAAYDWRLAYLDLERRDQYFSKLKRDIELSYDLTGEKTVLIGHSMGAQVIYYFLKWVEADGEYYGNGGDGWVEKYIDSFVNVAGTLLGVPKTVPALISGEMKDTIDLNSLAMYGLEKFFSRKERLEMLQTWGGIPSMLPKGGNLVWGNMSYSVEDVVSNNTDTYGNFIRFEHDPNELSPRNLTMEGAIEYILKFSPPWLQKRIHDQYSFGYAKSREELENNEKHHSHWTNPLEVALPNAPNMKIYCLYGVGNPTERAYVYQEDSKSSGLNVTIAYDSNPPVFFTDGDGTVPVLTHAMCHKWAQGPSPYNPANISVTIVEMLHQPERFDIRGGAKSAEHVDVLGRAELNEYILKIAAGKGSSIASHYITNMTEWTRILSFPL
ncbi:HER165Wp [Eremothecium sinecaudum]|uniref:Phospholipid:diacylglycerol acyltransferase n=1 Tax=Eremothecium sinecaudum TaxID=45286 RepID=A0A0X8HU20_9SACH|nr:HER165Wp [Eremothecium sinecaudum]AMD21444.1 HER165Wp [Eremothecium sinecaudum]